MAPPDAEPGAVALSFSGEELTLLAALGGAEGFPFAGEHALDDRAWAAVARARRSRTAWRGARA